TRFAVQDRVAIEIRQDDKPRTVRRRRARQRLIPRWRRVIGTVRDGLRAGGGGSHQDAGGGESEQRGRLSHVVSFDYCARTHHGRANVKLGGEVPTVGGFWKLVARRSPGFSRSDVVDQNRSEWMFVNG